MAKVRPSPLVQSVTGRVGGVVFAAGKSGGVVRQQPARRPRTTQRAATARANFSRALNYWQTMDPGVRQLWDVAANEMNRRNVDGQGRRWSGRALALSEWTQWGTPPTLFDTAPPARMGRPWFSYALIEYLGNACDISFDPPPGNPNGSVAWYMANSNSFAGFSSIVWRKLVTFEYTGPDTVAIDELYPQPWPPPLSGQIMLHRLVVREEDGYTSPPFEWRGYSGIIEVGTP